MNPRIHIDISEPTEEQRAQRRTGPITVSVVSDLTALVGIAGMYSIFDQPDFVIKERRSRDRLGRRLGDVPEWTLMPSWWRMPRRFEIRRAARARKLRRGW